MSAVRALKEQMRQERAQVVVTSASGLVDNIAEAIRRAVPKLPKEIQGQVLDLVSPKNLAIMSGVFVAWVAGHAYGAGEIADVLVAAYGAYSLGWDAIKVGMLLYSFVRHCMPPATSADLDTAASEFAEAVSLAGIDVVSAVLLGKAYKKAKSKMGKEGKPGVERGRPEEKPGEETKEKGDEKGEERTSRVDELLKGGGTRGAAEHSGGLLKGLGLLIGGYFGVKWMASRGTEERKK